MFAEKLKMDDFTGVVESGEVNKDGDYIQLRKVCQIFPRYFSSKSEKDRALLFIRKRAKDENRTVTRIWL